MKEPPLLEKPDLIPIERPAYFDEPSPKIEETKVPVSEEVVTTPVEETEETVEIRQKSDEEVFKRPSTAERRKVSWRFYRYFINFYR